MTCNVQYAKTSPGSGIDWNYTLTAPAVFVFDVAHAGLVPFHNDWIAIALTWDGTRETVTVTLAVNYAWDGCSVVPDYPGTLEASAVHDALYQFSEAIAAAWGRWAPAVLMWADNRFYDAMAWYRVPWYIRWTYRAGVGCFGLIYHEGAKLF